MCIILSWYGLQKFILHKTFLIFKGGAKVKRLASWILAIALVVGVLMYVKADVNHGHGPAHGETEHSEAVEGH